MQPLSLFVLPLLVAGVLIAAAVTAVVAAGLGMAFSRRTAGRPSSARSVATDRAHRARSASLRPKRPASSPPGRGGSPP